MSENHNHSILKSSSADESHDESRHVHFDKMKEVQVFDPNTGRLMGQTPTKEKAFETISSGGILTPQLSDMDITQSPESSMVSSVASIDKTFHHFDASVNDTLSIFGKTEEPAPEEFKFPEFDKAISDPSFSCPKTAEEFEDLLLEELTKTQAEILKMFEESDGEYRKKLEFLKNSPAGEWGKTEQNLIVISSHIAESLLLNLRSKFFAEKNEKCEQEIVDLQKENAEISELIKSKKVEPKRKDEDFHQVQNEYYDLKKQEMRARLDSVMILYEKQLEMEQKRLVLEMEVEEMQIQLKSIAEKEQEAKESFEKLMNDIDFEI